MSVGNLASFKYNRIVGIDASTKSLAFAVFEKGKPDRCGEVLFTGSHVFDRLYDAKCKTQALVSAGILVGDYVAIESPWTGKNPRTGIELAYVYGAIIGELRVANNQVNTVAPITWQTFIGNPNLKQHEKDTIAKANPGASKSALQVAGREFRKQRTLDFSRQHFQIPSNSDNIGDAVGIAWYAKEVLTKP